MQRGVDKILSMVDVLGTVETVNRYRKTVESIIPEKDASKKERYWTMYYRIANEFIANPKVTDKRSVIEVMFAAAKLNLNPDPIFGEIYFVPYAGKLTHQIGYKGMIKLSINSGLIDSVRTGRVFENDEWDYYEDENGQHFLHRPKLTMSEQERGKELFCYSVFSRNNGAPDIHIMESYHIDKIKKMVLARSKNTPWNNDLFEPEMRKKTCLRRHWKLQPKSEEVAYAIEAEETYERGEDMHRKHPELDEVMSEIIEKQNVSDNEDPISAAFDPDPNSEEGKQLSAELDAMN